MEELFGWLLGQRTTLMVREVGDVWHLSMCWRRWWFSTTHKFRGTYPTQWLALEAAKEVSSVWVKRA